MAEPTFQSVAFPTLDEAQVAEIVRFTDGPPRRYKEGETVFATGVRDYKFLLIMSGVVAIIDHSGNEPHTVVVYRHGQFAGEVSLLLGSPAVNNAIARGDTEVYELSRGALKRLLNQRPALSDLLLQAFIARRQILRDSPE